MGASAPLAGIDAIMLAGGLGTRLKAVLPDQQKVTAAVRGRPFVFRLIDRLAAAGARKVVLAVGYKADGVRAAFADQRWDGVEIGFSEETEPLGTGGAARLALDETASDPVLAMNGDSFAEIDLAALLARHRALGAAATLAIARIDEPGRYGLVEADQDGKVLGFVEKPANRLQAGWISLGIYFLARATLERLAPGKPASLERDLFPSLVGQGLYAAPFAASFIDIGVPESLARAETFFQGGRS